MSKCFCPLLRHQITKASLPKCSCLGVTVPNDYRSLVLSCQMMLSAQYRLRFGDCRDPLVTPCWWYKDLTTPAPVCLLFLPRSVSFSATQCRPPWILVAGALHPTTSFAALVLCQCSLLPEPSPGLECTSWHELSLIIGGCISDFVREWVSTARLGLISVSMSSTGGRPNINSNGVNLVELLLWAAVTTKNTRLSNRPANTKMA